MCTVGISTDSRLQTCQERIWDSICLHKVNTDQQSLPWVIPETCHTWTTQEQTPMCKELSDCLTHLLNTTLMQLERATTLARCHNVIRRRLTGQKSELHTSLTSQQPLPTTTVQKIIYKASSPDFRPNHKGNTLTDSTLFFVS